MFPLLLRAAFWHFHVPTNATSTATKLTSLNDITIDHVSATTATTTATMTQVPTTRCATTNASKSQLDKCKATQTQHKTRSPSILHPAKKAANNATLNLLLPSNQANSAITISSLLLLSGSARPVITTTTNANFSLLLIVETSSLLLLCSFECPANMMALNTINLLAFFVRYDLAIMIAPSHSHFS